MNRVLSKLNTRTNLIFFAMLSTLGIVWASKEILKSASSRSIPSQQNTSPEADVNESLTNQLNIEDANIFYSSIGTKYEKIGSESGEVVMTKNTNFFQVEIADLWNKEKIDKIYEEIRQLYPQATIVPIQTGNTVRYKIILSLKSPEEEALNIKNLLSEKTKLKIDLKKL